MDINTFDVLETLRSPQNCDIMHIYLVQNFNSENDTLIKQQSINHLKLVHVAWVRGIILQNKKESAVIVKDPTQKEHSITLKSTIQFVTNELTLSSILKDKSAFVVCSFNKTWTEGKKSFIPNDTNNLGSGKNSIENGRYEPNSTELYYISAVDFSTNALLTAAIANENPDASESEFPKNSSYFEYNLISFNNLVNLSDTIIKFYPLDFVPNIDKINWLQYTIPANAVYQTLSVFGDLYNDQTGETLTNVFLPLEFATKDVEYRKRLRSISTPEIKKFEANFSNLQPLPILCNLNSLDAPAQINIKNFNLSFQLPWKLIEVVLKNTTEDKDSLIAFFEELVKFDIKLKNGKNYTTDDAKKFIDLFKKMFVITNVYKSKFKTVQKTNDSIDNDSAAKTDNSGNDYAAAFNSEFANKSCFDFVSELTDDFLLQNPYYEESIAWNIFKSFCLACSDFVITPFCWNEGLDKKFKNVLWWYLGLEQIQESNWSNCFIAGFTQLGNGKDKSTVSFSFAWITSELDKLKLKLNFGSNFFDAIPNDNAFNLVYKSNALINTNLNTWNGGIETVPQMPEVINNLNEDWNPYIASEKSSEKMKYLCFLFFDGDVEEFVSKWLNECYDINHPPEFKTMLREKLNDPNDQPISSEEFIKNFIPEYQNNGNNDSLIYQDASGVKWPILGDDFKNNYDPEKDEDCKIYTWNDCSELWTREKYSDWWNPVSWIIKYPARHGANPPPDDPNQNYCLVWEDDDNVINQFLRGWYKGIGVYFTTDYLGNNSKIRKEPRGYKSVKFFWKATGTLAWKSTQKVVNNFYLQSSTSLLKLMTNKKNLNSKTILRFKLNSEWENVGWKIKSVNFDKHKSFFNTATNMTVCYDWLKKENDGTNIKIKNEVRNYVLDYSFQKNNPVCCLTQNKY